MPMNSNLFKVYRSPDGESGGVAVAEPVAAPDAQEAQGTVTGGEAEAKPAADAPAKLTDWQAYQKMQEKYAKRPNAKPTKDEASLMAKYQGKDESEIDGYSPDGETPKPKAEKPKTTIQPKQGEQPPAVPKGFEALVGEKSPVGAKTLEELPSKVESLHKEFQKLNGERGEVGRVLQEAGVKTLAELRGEITGARNLHRAVEDARKGDPKALEFLGLKPQQAQQQPQNGKVPDDILDEALYNRFTSEFQKLEQRNAELERKLAERFGDIDRIKDAEKETAMTAARKQAITELTSEFATLAAEAPHLWDPKAGNLHKAIQEYYDSEGDFHPGLKVFHELLTLVQEKKLPDLESALALWERKNRGSIIQQAKDDARRPFIGKPPTVGLSDQQQAHGGKFSEFTTKQLQNLGRPGFPKIPTEWVNEKTGDLIPSKIPAYARPIVLGEEE
jgi:chromosome segregation ATPase